MSQPHLPGILQKPGAGTQSPGVSGCQGSGVEPASPRRRQSRESVPSVLFFQLHQQSRVGIALLMPVPRTPYHWAAPAPGLLATVTEHVSFPVGSCRGLPSDLPFTPLARPHPSLLGQQDQVEALARVCPGRGGGRWFLLNTYAGVSATTFPQPGGRLSWLSCPRTTHRTAFCAALIPCTGLGCEREGPLR